MWQKLSTVSKVPAAEYFVKNFRIWCQGCRLCGVVPTTLAQSVMFQNRRSKNISRAKREDSAKDVQISPYPTRPQTEALMVQLSEACRLYNAALQERIEAYRTHHKSINYCDQAAQLTEIRKAGDLGLPNCHCAQDVLRRLEKAFKAFFQRIKRGQKPGFPRFKSSRRYDSITFPSHGDGNKLLSSGHLFVQGVGNIKVKLHRPLHGKIKTVSVKRECEHWYVCFSVETSVQPLPETKAAVGIDLGLSSFATLSDDAEIENPRLYRQAQKKLRRAQRRVARRKKGSKRRGKAVVLLRKIHQCVMTITTNWLASWSSSLERFSWKT